MMERHSICSRLWSGWRMASMLVVTGWGLLHFNPQHLCSPGLAHFLPFPACSVHLGAECRAQPLLLVTLGGHLGQA